MCISTAPAELFGTKIGFVADYTTKLHHLFYANSVQNLSNGPNAMILPIPGVIQKIHDTTDFGNFMEDISHAFAPPMMRSGKLGASVAKGITIEEVGAYTVLRCPVINAFAIEAALKQVPENKRPAISSALITWYRDFYGAQTHLAICCFDSKQMIKAQPIWIEYQPNDFAIGFYPGADSHDGTPPKIGKLIDRDQQLFFGAVLNDQPGNVQFSQSVPFPIKNANWLNVGNVQGLGQNGDWYINVREFEEFGLIPGYTQDKPDYRINASINTKARALCFAYELQK
jgi:hypothetical protein